MSAVSATSSSDWPTPTVSTITVSKPASIEGPQRLRRSGGETAKVTPGRHRPDVDVAIESVFLHPDPISEQCSAREGRARVHGQHADPLTTRSGARGRGELAVVDLPTPGAPVRPTTCARPVSGASSFMIIGSAGDAFSIQLIKRPSARGLPDRTRSDDAHGCRRGQGTSRRTTRRAA